MNALPALSLKGYKGGSTSTRTPVEAPDSLVSIQQARIIDLISEGDIYGLVDGVNSIYLDEAPASSYPSLQWDYRLGTQDQSSMPGFPAVESETTINVAVTASLPYIRAVTNSSVSALRINFSLSRFAKQDSSSGDTNGVRVEFRIEVASGFNDYQVVMESAFNGKTTSGYTRSVRVDLPRPVPSNGWRVRVVRLTPDSTSATISDVVNIASVTEIVDYKFRYPNSAIIGLSFDAETFGGAIPKRSYHIKGRIVRVPVNYDPESRTYSGVWTGEFKLAWTNCPVWIYYDLLLHERFGLGDRITAAQVDKWGLYDIGRYCDEMVDDGRGGLEPRFTCNMYLQKQADALRVMQDLAAVFRGITYWGLGQAMVSADMPSDPVYTYTNGNVLNGRFSRKGSKKSTIYTAILSAWNDPDDFYRTKYEYVQDDALVAKFGVRVTTLANIGCTSQGQAHRAAKWALLSNQYDTNTISFGVGLEGIRALPGQVIRVADQHRQGRRVGGRVRVGSTASRLILDQLPGANVGVGDEITVNLPTGQSETRLVASVNPADSSVTPESAFSDAPVRGAVWAYDTEDLKSELYRILAISEGSTALEYSVTALTYTEGKHAAVDFGTIISRRPTVAVPLGVIAAPENIQMTTTTKVDQSQAVSTLVISWDKVDTAIKYDVEWQRDNGGWVYGGRVSTTDLSIVGVYAGEYRVRVRAMNVMNVLSAWAEAGPKALEGKTTPPPSPVNITTTSEIFAIRLDWGFPVGVGDTAYSQIRIADSFEGFNTQDLGQFAYPTSTYTHSGMAAAVLKFFSIRLIDKSGNVGPWSGWVSGRSSADAGAILDYLVGKITASLLGQELLSEIGLIGGSGPGSVNDRIRVVNERLTAIRTELNNQIADVDSAVADSLAQLQDQINNIADLADSMPYKPDQTYTAGQSVLGSDGVIYQAGQSVPINTPPPNTTYWINVGQAVATAAGLASRVQTVETKVTSIEGVNTSQATQISGLLSAMDGKASASSVQSLTTRVTEAEGTITSQGTAITGLVNALPGKANVTTVDALTNTVTQQGLTIAAQGQSLTTISASIANLAGVNLMYNPSFERRGVSSVADGWEIGGPATVTATSYVQSGVDPKGIAQRFDAVNMSLSNFVDCVPSPARRPSAPAGQPFMFSIYFRATAGLGVRIFLQPLNSASQVLQTTNSATIIANGQWQRHSFSVPSLPANTEVVHCITRLTPVDGNLTAGFMELDRAQGQMSSAVSGWQDNNSALVTDLATQATATTSLAARVTQTETGLTSAANQLTNLSANIGNIGGQNLFYNPSFTKESASPGIAEGWLMDVGTSGTHAPSLVPSWLVSTEKAQRIDVTNLNLAGGYRGILIATANRPKAMVGTSVVASCYVRATAGLVFKIFMQAVNAAGTAAVTVSGPLIVATGGTQRIVYDYPNMPAGTGQVQVYFRLYGSDTVTAGFAEYTRAQLELGTAVSGWKDNSGVLTSDLAATASAVSGLSTVVTQQGTNITSVSQQVAALKASIGDGSDFSASPASFEFLGTTNGFVLGTLSGSPTLTANPQFMRMSGAALLLKNDGFSISGTTYPFLRLRMKRSGGARSGCRLYWANENGGWSEDRTASFTVDVNNTGWQIIDIDLSSNTAWVGKTITGFRLDLSVAGENSSIIDIAYVSIGNKMPNASAAALSAVTATVTQQGTNITSTSGRVTTLENSIGAINNTLSTKANSSALSSLESTVSQQGNTITSTSGKVTNLENSITNINGALDAKASSAALNSLQSTVTQQGSSITAQADSINGLSSTVNSHSAQLTVHAGTIANINGIVSSSYAVKVGVAQNGLIYAAGFGISIDNATGPVQSQFVVSADRFAIITGPQGGVTSPFIIENGQAFIADAVIKKATITNALIGQNLASQTLTSYGQPVMTVDFSVGQITIQNKAVNGAYLLLRDNGLFMVANGVVVIEMSNS